MKLIYVSLFSSLLYSCNHNKAKVDSDMVIKVQPFTGTDASEVKEVADSIRKYYPKVIIASPINLPDFAFYAPWGRYSSAFFLKSVMKTLDEKIASYYKLRILAQI